MARRAASMSLVLQGSALWRAPNQAPRISKPARPQSHGDPFASAFGGSCAKDCRPIRHACLDSGSVANRLDEPCFAGVCPTACPVSRHEDPGQRSARRSVRVSVWRFVRKGLAPKVARIACCCVKRHGVPLNTTLRRSNSTGAGTPDPFAQRLPVRAQGIEGV
jgi:hypothetical protein